MKSEAENNFSSDNRDHKYSDLGSSTIFKADI